jgi:transposase
MTAAALAPRTLVRRPWARLSDAAFAAIRVRLPGGDAEAPRGRGRPPKDLRRTLDAIFWVACSKGPWKGLPADLGKPEAAQRTLRRWARAGVLEPLMVKVSHPDADAPPVLQRLAYWIARAFRRMARIVSTAALALVRDVLRLVDACPAWPLELPDRNLSESARARLKPLENGLRAYARRAARAARNPDAHAPELVEAGVKAAQAAIRAVRAGWRDVRLGVCGNRHQWRLR